MAAVTETNDVNIKRDLSSAGLTNEETASDGSVEPSTPKDEPVKKKKKKVPNSLSYLLDIADWYNSPKFSGTETKEEGLLRGRRGAITRKEDPYDVELRKETERKEAQRAINLKRRQEQQEKLRIKLLEQKRKEKEKKAKEAQKKKEQEKLKQQKQAEKNKKLAAKQKEKDRLKKLKGRGSKSPSSSSTPDPESSILKSRKKKEVESELVDGYRPFLQTLVNDTEIPIRKDFFVKEVYEGSNDQVEDMKFTSASTTIQNYLKKYRNYKNVDPIEIDLNSIIFPKLKECYYLMESKDFELDPLEEIGKLMESLSVTYFPKDYKLTVFNPKAPYTSLSGKLSKGMETNDAKLILKTINEYNKLVTKIHKENGFAKHLQKKKTISRAFIHELLNQMYSRAVSPSVQKLKKYEAFSNFVYGELLPNFLSKAFDQTGLSHKSTFIDLGSGVGNVTIQAALEYGCESWGCEIMENASDLAELQHKVFEERCKYFGINPGKVGFFHKESFVANDAVRKIVEKCDVILVNNYIFSPDLNKEVIKLFQGLKTGTKIISLKSLVPAGHVVDFDDMDNIINRFKFECFPLENGSVSWTDRGGVYYITEVMPQINEEFLKAYRGRKTR